MTIICCFCFLRILLEIENCYKTEKLILNRNQSMLQALKFH